MHSAALHPDTHSQLWLPRSSLGACLRAAVGRNTTQAALNPVQRQNHLAATPLCSLYWGVSGHAHLPPAGWAPQEGPPPTPPLPRLLWCGPMTQPCISWNPGPVHSFTLLLQPDAVHRLLGWTVEDWVNRQADARELLPPDWLALADAVFHAPDDAQRLARVEAFLAPRWEAVRPSWPMQAHRYLDWAQSLALHAACSAPGRSLRQMERRIKRWTGVPLRQLRSVGRAEQAFFAALDVSERGGQPHWSELADAAGYTDQSHLCRETRRTTGFSPDELYRRIHAEESFWVYRLWR